MKKIVSAAAVLMLCLALFAGCAGKAQPETAEKTAVTVTDDLGRQVELKETPRRVAALTGSFAETWLLAGGELVAAAKDAWEDFDLELGDAVNLGSYMEVNLELLFETEPDLVIASSSARGQAELKDTLERAGVPVLYFEVDCFEDYLRMLKVCTELTGREDLYEQNGLKVEERVKAARDFALDSAEKNGAPSVLLLRAAASGVKAKGSDSTVLGIMLKDLGCVNIADGSDLLEELSLERIISDDPEHIFIVQQGNDDEGTKRAIEETLSGNPAWAGLSAVKADRVHYMDKHLYHFKPNARWGEAYEELAAILYGA